METKKKRKLSYSKSLTPNLGSGDAGGPQGWCVRLGRGEFTKSRILKATRPRLSCGAVRCGAVRESRHMHICDAIHYSIV